MSSTLNYLVTVDAASGAVVRVQRLGDGCELADQRSPVLGLSPSGAATVIVNIYAGGGGLTTVVTGPSPEVPHPEVPHPEVPHPEVPHPEVPHPEVPHPTDKRKKKGSRPAPEAPHPDPGPGSET
jgi:hypothetical protein